jgi:hypothetical protein
VFNGNSSYIHFGDDKFKNLYNYSIFINGYKLNSTLNNTEDWLSIFNNM